MQETHEMRRYEKPVRTIQGRPDLQKAVKWTVLEYGEIKPGEVLRIINKEFRVSRRYEPTHQAVTRYIRGVMKE